MRRLAERFTSVNMKATSKAAEDVFEMENEIFNASGVCEEDLGETEMASK